MRTSGSRSGFSLIEMAIAVSLMSVVLASAALVNRQGMRVFKVTQLQSNIEDRASRTASRLVAELENTNAILPVPDPFPVSDFVFQGIAGVVAGVVDPTDPARLFWRYSAGELNDGLDNNDNGLADEGEIVFTRNFGLPGERTIVLCRGVPELLEGETLNGADDNGNGLIDEPGFCVLQDGGMLVIRFSVAGRSTEGELTIRTMETGVRLRN